MRARLPQVLTRALVSGAVVTAIVAIPIPAQADVQQWIVAPGVVYTMYDTSTSAGPQRVHIIDIDPSVPGVSLNYATNRYLRDRAPASQIIAQDPTAVAGVNASYFDISDTGAPLGVGRARNRRVFHAPSYGWNNAFYQAADGTYHVGPVRLVVNVAEHPDWSVTGLNTPNVKPGSITVFTHKWGDSAGMSVINTPGRSIVGTTSSSPGRAARLPAGRVAKVPVREVLVKNGVVTANSATLHEGKPIHGKMLVGQGLGAQELATLPVGAPLHVSWALDQKPLMAVTGSQVLVRAGKSVATPDGENAPRTTVGIATNGHIRIISVDGRQSFAKGYSLGGMAALLITLGVTDAVNLDGGGSTTVVSRSADGLNTGVVNSPSAGHPRWVADALVVDYTAPPPPPPS